MIIPIKVTPEEKKSLNRINLALLAVVLVMILWVLCLYAIPDIPHVPILGGLFILTLLLDFAGFFICIIAKLVMYLKISARKINKHLDH